MLNERDAKVRYKSVALRVDEDGSLVDQPHRPQEIRGVRINLLVRDLRSDRDYLNENVYTLGNCNYGPFRDHYRRSQLSRMVEVKNHGLQ